MKAVPKKGILDQNINDSKSDILSSFNNILFRAYNFMKKVLPEV